MSEGQLADLVRVEQCWAYKGIDKTGSNLSVNNAEPVSKYFYHTFECAPIRLMKPSKRRSPDTSRISS